MLEKQLFIHGKRGDKPDANSRLRHSLLKKIILHITSVLVLAVGAITWVNIIEDLANQQQQLLEKDRLILEQLAAAVHSGFYTLNWVFVEESIQTNSTDEAVDAIFLLSPDGMIYLSSDDSLQLPRLGSGSELTWEDDHHFCMTRSVPIGNDLWKLVLCGSTTHLMDVGYRILSRNILTGLLIILLASLASFYLSRKITGSLAILANTAKEIGQGNFGVQATVQSRDEIGALAGHINSMSKLLMEQHHSEEKAKEQLEKEVYERTEELQLTNNRLTSILQTTAQGFFRVNNEQIIMEVNPRIAEILGRTKNELVGLSISELADGANRKIFGEQARLREQGKSSSYQIQLLHSDHTSVPCLFNATPLFNSKGKIIGSFAMVSDITALKETEHFLKEAKEKADKASNMKSVFLANMSHEIRTPLSGIIGALELLNHRELSPSRQRKLMNTAQQSADYLLTLLNDILDLSKIESGKLEPEERPFSLTQMVDKLQSMFLSQARQKNIQLQMVVHSSLPHVLVGDVRLLQQVCTNLLGNALKFTSEGMVSLIIGGKVSKDGTCLLEGKVSDTGIGIARENQSIIFETFSQVDTSKTRTYGGSGLGLAICRRLCTLMGGDIRLTSVEGKGSTFSFSVRLGIGNRDQLTAADRAQEYGSVAVVEIPALTILLVDDNEVNRDITRMLLEAGGHRITTATDGLEALQLLAKEDFDCVLMDIRMPRMDGVAAIRLIRACEQKLMGQQEKHRELLGRLHRKLQGCHTLVVALSANVFHHDQQKYLEVGMDACLAKPVQPDELARILFQATQKNVAPLIQSSLVREQTEEIVPADLADIKTHLQGMYQFSSAQIDTLLVASIRSIVEGLDGLNQSCRADNNRELAECAHKLKGTLANLGLSQATEKAQEIQLTAEKGDDLNYTRLISGMRRDLEPLLKEYKQYIDNNKPQANGEETK